MDEGNMLIYLCDDESKMLEKMERLLRAMLPESTIQTFQSGKELLIELQKKQCEILLLDIDMPEISGMDIARWIQNSGQKVLLIFVTCHDELVYESFQFHPFGFIRKQYLDNELNDVINECMKELQKNEQFFFFRSEGKDYRIQLSEIQYFEADGNYLLIHSQHEKYRFRSTITAIEDQYKRQGFIRIHKGFLVNQSSVKVISNEGIHLNSGAVLPLGLKYIDEAKKTLMRCLR